MKPDLNNTIHREEFDSDPCIAQQEAYSDGVLDRELGNTNHAKQYPEQDEIRAAYEDGYNETA